MEREPGNIKLATVEGESGQVYITSVGSNIEAGEADAIDRSSSETFINLSSGE